METQANLAHYIELQASQEHIRNEFMKAQLVEQRRQLMYVTEWLAPADYKQDHERFSEVRRDYPQTGQWLLKASKLKKWLTPSTNPEPWRLWLYGIPGAGWYLLVILSWILC